MNDTSNVSDHPEQEVAQLHRQVSGLEVQPGEDDRTEPERATVLALYRDITERKQTELALRERIKELTCLYGISHLVDSTRNLAEILQGTVDLIPDSWQYPDVTTVLLRLDGKTYASQRNCNMSCTDCTCACMSQPIVVQGQPLGDLRVCYTKEKRDEHEGPFLREERDLINAIAERLGHTTERNRMEEELQKMDRLESIGMLAGGIAHDLNNFLTGLVGNIGLARETDDPVEIAERLQQAETDAMAIKDLSQQLLTFSKGGAPLTKPVDLADLLKQSVVFTLSGSNIHCDCVLSDDCYPVEIDAGQIKQVINNLVINAQQAMPAGGTIRVLAKNIKLDKEDGMPLDAGCYVMFSVEDEGVGIAEEDRNRIFDPFFSTKPKGNGLGLATSYSIIQKHNGLITVESELGVGTRFNIYLPATTRTVLERKETDGEAVASVSGDITVLVMDDQKRIRDIVVRSLQKIGCEVITSMDGAETIEKYKDAMRSGNPFDAVILDLTIPGGMGGGETVKRLKEIDPGVTAIVASGYSEDPIMTDYIHYGFKAAIAKPYGIRSLRKVLHEVLNNS